VRITRDDHVDAVAWLRATAHRDVESRVAIGQNCNWANVIDALTANYLVLLRIVAPDVDNYLDYVVAHVDTLTIGELVFGAVMPSHSPSGPEVAPPRHVRPAATPTPNASGTTSCGRGDRGRGRRPGARGAACRRPRHRHDAGDGRLGPGQPLTARGLQNPADLWVTGVKLDDLDDDGNVDPARVDAAVAALLKDRPHWGQPAVNFNGGYGRLVPTSWSFGDFLCDDRQR
jgi:hypothetical protein